MSIRKMATIRRINNIFPIDNADAIEQAIVDGWGVVVKKNEFNVGDLVIFCEIDSFIPNSIASFLTKPGKEPKEYNGIRGERLRTVKLRNTLSQGLILPYSLLDNSAKDFSVGDDVSEYLGIIKYDPPIPAQLAGLARGNFPKHIPKTDQERCQNLVNEIELACQEGRIYEVTEKLHGSSATYFLDFNDEFHVCSRNLDLKSSDTNTFWNIAEKYNIEDKMRKYGYRGYAIQGELIGEGINGNMYGIKGHDFYVFDIYTVENSSYLSGTDRRNLCEVLRLNHVPVLEPSFQLEHTVEEILKLAEAKSVLNRKVEREGIVFKNIYNTSDSFKAVSNKYLLKGGE